MSEKILAYTQPDILFWGRGMLPYQKLGAISLGGELSHHISHQRFEPRPLPVTEEMAEKLAITLTLAAQQQKKRRRTEQGIRITCHMFVRLLTGMEPSFDPPFERVDAARIPQDSNLSIGEIGIVSDIYEESQEAYHAVLGLGENVPESLQFLWGDAVGICNNRDLLQFVNSMSPLRRAALFRCAAVETVQPAVT